MIRANGVMSAMGIVAGPYELGDLLGAGSMGVVYKAALPDGLPVAVKLLHPQLLTDAYAVERFRDEGVAGLIVRHPNVISVLDRGETADKIPFLVMARIGGESLAARLHREGPLSLRRAAMIIRQILAGLHALHTAGVIHGDVKTDNILVATDEGGSDTAVLVDLGLASPWFVGNDEPVPEDALISGTPEYMAPELGRGARPAPATDIYAAGVVLYELITGSIPFSGATVVEIIGRHHSDDVTPPSFLDPDSTIPPILDRIVMRALEKNPERRFKSAAAFAAALEVALPCLDDSPAGLCTRLSRETPTLDWERPGEARDAPRRERIAAGISNYPRWPISIDRRRPRRRGFARRVVPATVMPPRRRSRAGGARGGAAAAVRRRRDR